MSALVLELRPKEEQTAFNLRRWKEVLTDRTLVKIPGRVETDRHGRTIMSPPPAPKHGAFQFMIGSILEKCLPGGRVVTECPLSTADGVKGLDVAWISKEAWARVANRSCLTESPEICVEVISPSNSEEEIREKMALYFDAGAREVWLCDSFGAISFFGPGSVALDSSELCPRFPREIAAT